MSMDFEKPDPMTLALDAARLAGNRNEVPVGAVIVHHPSGRVLAKVGNETIQRNDATAHAEILAIRAAGQMLGTQRLSECDLYVTLEPCAMCAAAISFARIRRLYYGVVDVKGGAVESGHRFYSQPTCHHGPEVYGGIREEDSATLLREFFQRKRV